MAKPIHLPRETSPAGVIPLCSDQPIRKESGEQWITDPELATCPKCLEAAGKVKPQEQQQQTQQTPPEKAA